MSNSLLDIIITHYDEPWETGKKFFDMIEHQRCFDRSTVTITLVQDGEENALPWSDLLSQYSFHTRIITIRHGGVGAARNAGLANTKSQWVMFCDFDDMFADVSSLSMIVDLLPTDDYDVLWGSYCREEISRNKQITINKIGADFSTVQNKLYRRDFLTENNITFDTHYPLHADVIFNASVISIAPAFRIGSITTPFYTYFKTYRNDSMSHKPGAQENKLKTIFPRDNLLTRSLYRRNLKNAFKMQVARTIIDAYYMAVEVSKINDAHSLKDIRDYYKRLKKVYHSIPAAEIEVVKSQCEIEMMNYIQDQYNGSGAEYTFVYENITLDSWVKRLDSDDTQETEQIIHLPEQKQPQPDDINKDKRIAVYCGTFNTYTNMLASAKSLLYNTKMDRIYFLIEDDEFPQELPDIIQTINIRKHPLLKLLDPCGPNYNNAWTYMCMTRALFPKLFPQYHKILSLDIDTIINDDISELFDIDLTNNYLAGVPEPQRQNKSDDPVYINFGVVMMNLDRLRDDKIDDDIIEALNKNKFGCPEQDAFNKYCARRIIPISNDFNATIYSGITGEPDNYRILHYAGINYSKNFIHVKSYSVLPWDEVLKEQGR